MNNTGIYNKKIYYGSLSFYSEKKINLAVMQIKSLPSDSLMRC